jgi:hypothetical protein
MMSVEENHTDQPPAFEELYEVEVIDGEIVEHATSLEQTASGERSLTWTSPQVLTTAAIAATGFVAGAATLALLRRYGQARLERAAADELPPSRRVRTYVVHVRTLPQYPE